MITFTRLRVVISNRVQLPRAHEIDSFEALIKRLICALLLFAGLGASVAAMAAASICTAITGTNDWGTNGTWTNCGGTPPQNGDSVVIPNNSTVTLNVDTAQINDINIAVGGTLQGGAVAHVLTINNGAGVDITNGGTIDFGPTKLATISIRQNSQWTGAGTWNLSTIDFNTNRTLNLTTAVVITMSGAASPFINTGSGIITNAAGVIPTWNFAGSVAQTLPSRTQFVYGNVNISNTAGVTLGVALGANILGNLSVAASGILNNGGFAITLPSAKNFSMGASSQFNLTTTSTMVTVSGGGTKTFNASSTVNYAGTAQTVTAETYGNLTLSGSGIKTMSAGTTTVAGNFTMSGTASTTAAGNMPVTGNFVLGAGTSIDGATFSHSVGGTFTNNGSTFTASTSTFTLNGASAQTVNGSAATTFNNLTINNSKGIILSGVDTTVAGTLTFTLGTITTSTNKVVIPSTGSVSRTSGHVVGNLQKNVATGATARTFEVGDINVYAPVAVSFGNVTVAGNLTATTVGSEHPDVANSSLNSAQDVNRYWVLTNSGITFNNYAATFTYSSASPIDLDSGVTAANFVIAKADTCNASLTSCTWSLPTMVGTPSTTTATAGGMTTLASFAIGQRLQTLNNFLITVPASPVTTCSAQPITITARNASNVVLTTYSGLVALTTSTSHGDWAVNAATGTLNNGTADDGAATYQFATTDNGTITLNLTDTHADDLTVTVTDGGASVSNVSATLQFRGNVFVITNDAIQVAGRNQAMTVQMNRGASCAVAVTGYTGSKNLKAWVTLDASDPGGAAPKIGAVSLPSAQPGSNNVTLTFSNGVANFNLSTTDIGKYVLNLLDDSRAFATGADITGSSPGITTRPFAIAISGVGQGGTANPGGTASSGSKFIAAADSFQATVGSYLWNAAADSNNDGVPDASATLGQVTGSGSTVSYRWSTTLAAAGPYTPGAGALGTLANGVLAGACPAGSPNCFTNGVATPTNLTYSDVGSFTLAGVATNFLNSGITLNALVFNQAGNQSGVIGRFFPDHFALTASALTAACNGFTYMDQAGLNLSFTLQAQGKTNAITPNYDNNTLGYPVAAVNLVAENANAGVDLGARITSTLGAARWNAGQFTVASPASTFTRTATPDGSYDALAVGVKATDTDGPVITARDINAATTGSCSGAGNCDAKQIGASTMVRFGRLRVQNSNGSQLIAMPIPVSAQYWNGTGFATNQLDNCTSMASANVSLGNFQGNLGAGQTTATVGGAFAAGIGSLRLSAPGAARNGSVDVSLNLTGGTAGASCTAGMPASTGGSKTYLQGAWCGTTYVNDPTARATFGTYRNSDRFIYQRENF